MRRYFVKVKIMASVDILAEDEADAKLIADGLIDRAAEFAIDDDAYLRGDPVICGAVPGNFMAGVPPLIIWPDEREYDVSESSATIPTEDSEDRDDGPSSSV